MNHAVQTAIVSIKYVSESRTKGTYQQPEGLRRFVIGAEKTLGDSLGERLLGLTTVDQFKASLCRQACDQDFLVRIKYQDTRYFDKNLLYVELATDEQAVSA